MTPQKKGYHSYCLIALGIIVIASTWALVSPSFDGLSSQLLLTLSILVWLLSLSAAIFLYIKASNTDITQSDSTRKSNKSEDSIPERKKSSKKDPDRLDIQSASRKIIRKTNISGENDKWGKQLLSVLVTELEIMSGVVYFRNEKDVFEAKATYALPHSSEPYKFKSGEGLCGQVALNQQVKIYHDIPKHYSKVFSGLGAANPSYLAMIPLMSDDLCLVVIEIAGFRWGKGPLKQLFDLLSRELSSTLQERIEGIDE